MIVKNGWLEPLEKKNNKYRCKKWKLYVELSKKKKRVRRFNGAYSDAKKALDDFVLEVELDINPKNELFDDYAKYWLSTRVASNTLQPSTLQSDRHIVNRLQGMFPKAVKDVTTRDIRDKIFNLTNLKTDEQVSNLWKKKIIVTLSNIFNMAIIDKLIVENPCNNLPKLKADKPNRKALNNNEIDELLKALESEPMSGFTVAIYILLYEGLRRSEVCALTWDDVNFKKKTLSINKAWKDATGKPGDTKSASSNRVIPLHDDLIPVLKEWYELSKEYYPDNKWVLLNTKGDVLRPPCLYKTWRDFLDKHKLTKITLHELRHTNFTKISRQISEFDLMFFAGWSNLKPANVYVHRDRDALQKGLNSVKF